MTTTEHSAPPRPERLDDPDSAIERTEDVLTWAGLAVAVTIRVAELAAITAAALLVVPPLAILAVVVVVPVIALTALVAIVAAAVALPVFFVRHVHRHRAAHGHPVVRRLADLARSEAAMTPRVRGVVARALRKLYMKPTPHGRP